MAREVSRYVRTLVDSLSPARFVGVWLVPCDVDLVGHRACRLYRTGFGLWNKTRGVAHRSRGRLFHGQFPL